MEVNQIYKNKQLQEEDNEKKQIDTHDKPCLQSELLIDGESNVFRTHDCFLQLLEPFVLFYSWTNKQTKKNQSKREATWFVTMVLGQSDI